MRPTPTAEGRTLTDDRRARLREAKLSALVRDRRGADPSAVEQLGANTGALLGDEAFLLAERAGAATVGSLLIWAARRGAGHAVLFADEGAPLAARLAAHFAEPPEVRAVVGAGSESVDPEPMPFVPPGPDGADDLLVTLSDAGLEVVLEEGSWRGELLGLEVARLARWADGELHLEAGVGRFDRDAAAAVRGGEDPTVTLARSIGVVAASRYPGAPTHPLTLLARSRWLRAAAIADPARVGARSLSAVQSSLPAQSVREESPAAAVGTGIDGSALIVVFASGADPGLVPLAADTREMQAPGARLVLAVAPRDHLAFLDDFAAALREPATVIDVAPEWG